jgi:bacterioferritin
MKGNAKVIELLNEGLCAELTTINQYFVHSRMRANWGYNKLAQKDMDESIEEMKHAQRFIERILFLEGVPNMQKYKKIMVGEDVKQQLEYELEGEYEAVKLYNEGLKLSREVGDNGSADLFQDLLNDEEAHVDYLEAQLSLIKELGIQNYLSQQL